MKHYAKITGASIMALMGLYAIVGTLTVYFTRSQPQPFTVALPQFPMPVEVRPSEAIQSHKGSFMVSISNDEFFPRVKEGKPKVLVGYQYNESSLQRNWYLISPDGIVYYTHDSVRSPFWKNSSFWSVDWKYSNGVWTAFPSWSIEGTIASIVIGLLILVAGGSGIWAESKMLLKNRRQVLVP